MGSALKFKISNQKTGHFICKVEWNRLTQIIVEFLTIERNKN